MGTEHKASTVREKIALGEAIMEALDARGMTRADFAARVGIRPKTMERWHLRPPAPSASVLEGVVRALKIGGTLPRMGRRPITSSAEVPPPRDKSKPDRPRSSNPAVDGIAAEVQTILELLLEAVPDAMLYQEVARRASKGGVR